jgi:hypothetical protein
MLVAVRATIVGPCPIRSTSPELRNLAGIARRPVPAGPSGQHRRRVQAGPARSVAVGSMGCVGEYGERGVEAVMAAPVGLVVGCGGDESDQLVQFVIGGGQGGAVAVGAHAEHEPFTVGV